MWWSRRATDANRFCSLVKRLLGGAPSSAGRQGACSAIRRPTTPSNRSFMSGVVRMRRSVPRASEPRRDSLLKGHIEARRLIPLLLWRIPASDSCRHCGVAPGGSSHLLKGTAMKDGHATAKPSPASSSNTPATAPPTARSKPRPSSTATPTRTRSCTAAPDGVRRVHGSVVHVDIHDGKLALPVRRHQPPHRRRARRRRHPQTRHHPLAFHPAHSPPPHRPRRGLTA